MKYLDDNLLTLCADYGLSDQVQDALYRQAEYLHVWHKEILPASLTSSQRAAALKKVETMAMELAVFIDSLPGDLKWDLDQAYFGEKLAKDLELRLKHSVPIELDPVHLGIEGSVLPKIAKAAGQVAAKPRITMTVEKTRGRPSILGEQAYFIRRIAECVHPAGILPSTGGRFRPLCEAVFEVASVPFPERALRHFIRDVLPDMDEEDWAWRQH